MRVSWKSCWRGLVGSLVGATASLLSGAAVADDWSFTQEIPCATAPVYGMQFQRCWSSQVRTFRIGAVRAWRMSFGDSQSESSIGFYRMVEAHGVGGMGPVSASTMVDWVRNADALKNLTEGGTGWASNVANSGTRYVTFRRNARQCIAFVRNGPAVAGQVNWILGAAFCRESAAPIPADEAQFVFDAILVRG
jgi:hypothetical protein